MRDDPARQRIERIMFDDEQASAARQPRGQIHDRFLARLRRNVVHDVGKNDQAVIAMQFVEPVCKQAAFAQRWCNLVQARRGHVVAVDRILRTMQGQGRRQRADAAAEIQNFGRRRAEQTIDIRRLVFGEILGRFAANGDAAVEHRFVVRGKLIEFRHVVSRHQCRAMLAQSRCCLTQKTHEGTSE